VISYILKNAEPPLVSLVLDLEESDTWSLCGAIMKKFPNLEELGFSYGGRGKSILNLDALSSELCLGEFRGSRFVLKDARLRWHELGMFEALGRGLWSNVTTVSLLQSRLFRDKGGTSAPPSNFFRLIFPKLKKLVVSCRPAAGYKSPGFLPLVKLFLSSSRISHFEIRCGDTKNASEEQIESSVKTRSGILRLFRKYIRCSLKCLVDGDAIGPYSSVSAFWNAYKTDPAVDFLAFKRVKFVSFRLERNPVGYMLGEPLHFNLLLLWTILGLSSH
jgi:hypothetical protein